MSTWMLFYDITNCPPENRDAVLSAGERLAPSRATLTEALLDADGTGRLVYVVSGSYDSLDDGELYSRLEALCDFDKSDNAEDADDLDEE